MRSCVSFIVSASDRQRLRAVVSDPKSPQKYVWRAHGLSPHRWRSFKLTNDPAFAEKWLARHPRWTFHFTPTSCSWLNAVEGFFAKLTRRRLKHGVFHSVVDLQAAINRFIRQHNDRDPKPFVWKAKPDHIIAARNRGFQTLETIHWSLDSSAPA